MEHEEDPAEDTAIVERKPARIAEAPLVLRDQGLDQLPQLV